MRKILFITAFLACANLNAQKQLPLVYDVEDTGVSLPQPKTPEASALPLVYTLRNPLLFQNGRKQVKKFKDWRSRRHEISSLIQHYEIGTKPKASECEVKARMDGDTLIVDVTRGGQTLTLKSEIRYPKVGQPPYAVLIGTSGISLPRQLFSDLPLATMTFREGQVNDYRQWGKHHDRGEHHFDRLFPELKENGAYSEWAWGLSRLIDGLQQLGPEKTRIDTRHIGVTGCSYAGKMALFCGAFDERVALTIAQEPGGGGAAAWRVSNRLDSVETLDRTDYHWFKESMRDNFGEENTFRLPYDHHELVSMIFPRAVLMLGNTDYHWLADESGYVSMNAAIQVWQHFGVADRIGFSIEGGHGHCQLPQSQYPEVRAFINRFLLGGNDDTSNVRHAPDFTGKVDLSRWIKP